jgi:hypothetical protein
MKENFTFYEPDEQQLQKFHKINEWTDDEWERRCVACDDCSICNMAIHQQLYTTTRHTCTYGMSEKEFRVYMADADCYY